MSAGTAAPIGSGRGGVTNTSYANPNGSQGFSNTTPRIGAQSDHSNLDIDEPNYNNSAGGSEYNNNTGIGGHNGGYNNNRNVGGGADHHTVRSMESIVDRILNKSGPPTSSLGNPGPLGLAGFAATTFMLSCWNANLLVSTTKNVVLPMALWYGGIAQFAAGMWEFAANNTFGATAFTSYGAFWLSYATLVEFYAPAGYASAADINSSIAMFLLPWTIFTAYMCIGSLRMSWALFAVFFLLTITFALLTGGAFINGDALGSELTTRAGGWFGIFTAFAAWYASAAVVINGTFGAQLCPIGVIGPLHPHTPGLSKIPYVHRQVTATREAQEAEAGSSISNSPVKQA